MSPPIIVLLVALIAIVILQTMNRLAGAIALFLWCGAALAYGMLAFDRGVELKMFGIQAERWNFIAFMVVMMGYNLIVVYRVVAHRKKAGPNEELDPLLDDKLL